jgi:photosystem II stability/assembly factor-like uncharacterized protein
MRTEDGGQSWSVQYTVKNGLLTQVHFVNDREGWAVGSKRTTENDDQAEHAIVLVTADRGLHWTERFTQPTEANAADSVADIHAETGSKVTFLTDNGSLFTTDDRGGRWHRIKMPEAKYPQLANLRLTIDPVHQLWVLSSANSREVVAATLTRMEPNNQWVRIDMADWYIADVEFLSTSEIAVCGFIGSKVRQQALENTEGIVAFSSDRGKTWRIILRTKDAPRINTLALRGANQLLAVGDNGWVFKIKHEDSK